MGTLRTKRGTVGRGAERGGVALRVGTVGWPRKVADWWNLFLPKMRLHQRQAGVVMVRSIHNLVCTACMRNYVCAAQPEGDVASVW